MEIAIMNGTNGAQLICEKMKARNLFRLKTAAKERVKMVWNPQKGDTPIKIPNAMESALVLLLPSVSKIFSLKNLLKPFLRKYL